MAGILNSKERMIDFIITPQGRRQIADGRMKVEFASVTDRHTFYTSSNIDKVAEDASQRVFFETYSSPSDMIFPEVDGTSESGNVQPFRAGNLSIDGKIFASGTFNTGSVKFRDVLSGSKIVDKAEELSIGLLKHFEGLQLLGTEDVFSNSSDFKLSAQTGSFVITDQDIIANNGRGVYLKDISPVLPQIVGVYPPIMPVPQDGLVDLDTIPSLHTDPRFSHLPNYRYLPPVNLPLPLQAPGEESLVLGQYPDLASGNDIYADIHPTGSLATRQNVLIEFEDTSRDNNIAAQMLEFSVDGVEKLSIVDYGIVPDPEDETVYRHIYFLGKLLKDGTGSHTFINIFTLAFEE
jgi:hypothetical protein